MQETVMNRETLSPGL